MMSKNPLVLSVVVVALFGVSVFCKCQDDPTGFCVAQALLHPIKSVRCFVNASTPFLNVTNSHFNELSKCSKELAPNPATRDFIGLVENILSVLNNIINSCGKKPNGELAAGFWCGTRSVYKYIKLRKLLKKAEKAAASIEQFNSCVSKHISSYVQEFPKFRLAVNYCIFHKAQKE